MDEKSNSALGLILALWVAGLCAAAQFAKVSVIFPELLQLYPDAGSAAGFLVSLLSLLGVVLGLFIGIVVAGFGTRNLLLGALFLGGLISAYQATLPPFSAMLASRLLEGASHLIIVVAAPTLIAQVSSQRHRAAAMTLWGTFFGVAFALVAWFGLPLVKAFGLGSLFALHSVAMFTIAAVLFIILPGQDRTTSGAPHLNLNALIRRHIETYKSAFIAAPALGWLFYTLSFVSVLTILPNYVAPEHRAFVVGAMPLASIISSMTIGVFLLYYFNAIKVVMLGFILCLVTSLAFWFFPGSIPGGLVLFAALGLVQGASFAAVPHLNKDNQTRAYANGALAQMGNLGNLTGTPLLLLMTDAIGFHGLIMFAVICYAGGFAVHVWMALRRKRIF